jgi:hypothetical protein
MNSYRKPLHAVIIAYSFPARYGSIGVMQVRFRLFKSLMKSWDTLCEEAAAFATEVGRERLISMSVSEDSNEGVIVVWYWE